MIGHFTHPYLKKKNSNSYLLITIYLNICTCLLCTKMVR